MSSCAVPAGSPCRTGKGRVAAQYHTARFRLVPRLAKALSVPVPPVRKPGSAWTELPRLSAAGAAAGHVRIGYARASTVRQLLDTQADSLRAAGVTRIFAEKISTRAVTRPELDKAVALAREIRASGAAVTIVVHEHKRLGRGIELAALAGQLRAADIGSSSTPASSRACTTRPASCSPYSPPCRGWNASTSATAPWRATSRPASEASRSAARSSPTTRCSPLLSTCEARK
jgi:hypothetical protein